MSTPEPTPPRRRSPRVARHRASATRLSDPNASIDQEGAVLAQRAADLARPLPQVAALPAGDVSIVVVIGGQRLGFPSRHVQEAVNVTEITVLPGLPPHVLGLANVRSRVLPVFTVAPLLRLSAPPEAATKLLLLTTARGDFAVPIDQLEGIVTVDPATVQRTIAGESVSLVQGVTADGLLLVDVPAVSDELALSADLSLSRSSTTP